MASKLESLREHIRDLEEAFVAAVMRKLGVELEIIELRTACEDRAPSEAIAHLKRQHWFLIAMYLTGRRLRNLFE